MPGRRSPRTAVLLLAASCVLTPALIAGVPPATVPGGCRPTDGLVCLLAAAGLVDTEDDIFMDKYVKAFERHGFTTVQQATQVSLRHVWSFRQLFYYCCLYKTQHRYSVSTRCKHTQPSIDTNPPEKIGVLNPQLYCGSQHRSKGMLFLRS